MKWWKKCPLLMMLVLSWIGFSVLADMTEDGVYDRYRTENKITPNFAAIFLGIKDEVYPWDEPVQTVLATNVETEVADMTINYEAEIAETEAEESEAEETEAAQSDLTETQVVESIIVTEEESCEVTEEENVENEASEPVYYDFVNVEEGYFEDAVFIGDSRTQGLYEYGGLKEIATFYSKTSLTVYDLFKKEKAFISEDNQKKTLSQALSERQFGKIYLMLGINELGTGTHESFFEEYAKAVFKIRELQPDALIFVQGIMRVGSKKNENDNIFNNLNINIRNVELETLHNGQDIFYIDVNDVLCDENGNLFDDWTYDQIHLKAKYYGVWKDYLFRHGIIKS